MVSAMQPLSHLAPPQPQCRAYFVYCIPGISPARGLLHFAPDNFHAATRHFCTGSGHAGVGKRGRLLKRLNISRQARIVPAVGCTCPTVSLLPHNGAGVSNLAECNHKRHYPVFQCSNTPIVPKAFGHLSTVDQRRALGRVSRSYADVLLVTSDNRGHGFFAMVGITAYAVLGWHLCAEMPYITGC